jgi:hypothetical protein
MNSTDIDFCIAGRTFVATFQPALNEHQLGEIRGALSPDFSSATAALNAMRAIANKWGTTLSSREVVSRTGAR